MLEIVLNKSGKEEKYKVDDVPVKFMYKAAEISKIFTEEGSSDIVENLNKMVDFLVEIYGEYVTKDDILNYFGGGRNLFEKVYIDYNIILGNTFSQIAEIPTEKN